MYLQKEDNKLNIAMNLRIPVNTSLNSIIEIFKNKFADFNVEVMSSMEPLYIDKNNKLVTTLCDIFNEEYKTYTNYNNISNTYYDPIAIGGATYARAFNNCVSFGMNFPGDEDMCHKVDEFIEIDKLILATNIYAKAIYELFNL